MKTNVRLLRGPILRLAMIKPAVRFQKRTIELPKSKIEQNKNNGLLPIRSESIPAEKLPTE